MSGNEHEFVFGDAFFVIESAPERGCHRPVPMDAGTTLDDLRDAVTRLEELERAARRVLGGSHPTTVGIENTLRDARAALHARETPSAPG